MPNSLGEFVKCRRQSMGLSLRELAAECGISHTHIDSIEKGYDVRSGREVNPTSATIRKLALGLHVPESEIMKMQLSGDVCDACDDEKLKYALFGTSNVSDELLDEVKSYAQFIKLREDGLK